MRVPKQPSYSFTVQVIDSMVLLKGAPVIVQTINPDDPEKVRSPPQQLPRARAL